MMAHDLRNPLAAIMANLAYLEVTPATQSPDVQETLADIKLAAESLLRMIDNHAAIGQLESPNAAALPRAPVPLGDCVRVVVERAQALMRAQGIALAVRTPPEEVHVAGDRALFELLVENLLANAARHVRRGKGAALVVEARGPLAALTLEDDGPPFGPVERDLSREGQAQIKLPHDGRYSRGLGLYVVGLVTRAFGGAAATGAADARAALTLTFPRVTA